MKILTQIINYDDKIIEFALGNFGKSLKKFASIADDNNKEILEYITDDFSEKIYQMLELVSYGYKNNFQESIISLSKCYNKFFSDDLKYLDKKIRFIKDFSLRNSLRKNRKVSTISLSTFYDKPHIIWHSLPDNFDFYTKDSLDYKDYIISAKIKENRFRQLGCEGIANHICEEINKINNNFSKNLYGYYKISIKNASIILSKINGYKLEKNNLNYEIKKGKFFYLPKICPVYILDKNLPIIDELEKQSLFDHYLVILPSNKNLNLEEDLQLMKNKSIIPILLGERDGICYFISYY